MTLDELVSRDFHQFYDGLNNPREVRLALVRIVLGKYNPTTNALVAPVTVSYPDGSHAAHHAKPHSTSSSHCSTPVTVTTTDTKAVLSIYSGKLPYHVTPNSTNGQLHWFF